jgi:DNA gyrase subunit B
VSVVGTSDITGTTITFKPDAEIFSVLEYKYDVLAGRLRELAYLNTGIKLTLTDRRVVNDDGSLKEEIFHSTEGLREFVRFLDATREPLFEDVIHISTEKFGTPVEVAMMYNQSYNENIFSTSTTSTHRRGYTPGRFPQGIDPYAQEIRRDSKMLEKVKVEISVTTSGKALPLSFPSRWPNSV